MPIARAYFCPMVDFKSEAILGFSLAIGGGFNAKNIGRAFEFALRPPQQKSIRHSKILKIWMMRVFHTLSCLGLVEEE